jgi:hypothetical protein
VAGFLLVAGLNFEILSSVVPDRSSTSVELYCFKTSKAKSGNNARPRFAKSFIRGAIRKNRIATTWLEDLIKGLECVVVSLNASIDAVLEEAQVRDPTHIAYPVAARTMSTRRDNIQGTIAVLSAQLAKIKNAESTD